MAPRRGWSRAFLAIAAGSFLLIVVAYLVAPADRRARAWLADLAWTWTSGFAVIACTVAAIREARERPWRGWSWTWVGVGCAAWLVTQLLWDYAELVRGAAPGLADLQNLGFFLVYPCFFVGVAILLRGERPRRPDPELVLDAGLVTFTAAALSYAYLYEAFPAVGRTEGLASGVLPLGAMAVLWLILMQLLRRREFPIATAGLGVLGIGLFCAGDMLYTSLQLRHAYAPGSPVDWAWDIGFLVIASAAALTLRPDAPGGPARMLGGMAPRTLAVLVGIAGMTLFAIQGAVDPDPPPATAYVILIGGAILAARFAYSISADRRYAALLEGEVAHQTNSLMDSLATAAAAERSLRTLMEAVPDAIVVLDRDGQIVDLNAAARGMVAAPVAQQAGGSVFESLEGEALRVTRENLALAFAGDVRRFEVPFVRGNKMRGISAVLYAPVRDGGRVTRVLALARDITDQRRTESQLQQAEKLAALGQLVSGVAHEINNPAAIISGFAQTLMLDELTPDQREMIKMVYDEATRIGRITANLLAFARAGGRDRTLSDMNDLVRRTFALRSYHLSTLNIQVALELDPAEPHVWGNGSELQQMILNLLINAEQALTLVDGPRTITLRTAADDDEVRFECVDTGPGIAADVRPRIFDPFFTTKPEGIGTGLGLSICYGIVHDHGGRITVESEPGHGAAFRVSLPRDPRTERRPAAEPPSRFADSSPLSALLIDDEAGLRQAVARYLNRRGVQVRAVGDGGAGLDAIRAQEFDVIVTDVRMPGMSGKEFVERLRAMRPDLVPRLIFSTGDTFAADTTALLQTSGARVIVKPFDLMALERLMREVAATRASA